MQVERQRLSNEDLEAPLRRIAYTSWNIRKFRNAVLYQMKNAAVIVELLILLELVCRWSRSRQPKTEPWMSLM